jgi:hypothetical protein
MNRIARLVSLLGLSAIVAVGSVALPSVANAKTTMVKAHTMKTKSGKVVLVKAHKMTTHPKMIKVKAHTMKTKSGKVVVVKAHMRKASTMKSMKKM